MAWSLYPNLSEPAKASKYQKSAAPKREWRRKLFPDYPEAGEAEIDAEHNRLNSQTDRNGDQRKAASCAGLVAIESAKKGKRGQWREGGVWVGPGVLHSGAADE